jgi:ribonucleoside-diphosphate reductase alpha chain
VNQDGNFDFDGFKETTAIGARFLDNVIDYNLDRHALEEQKQNAMNDRRVGLGILGLGDMLVKMGIKYDSDEALETIGKIMEIHRNTAYETSVDLAKEKGQFPNFDWDGYSQSLFVKDLPKNYKQKLKTMELEIVLLQLLLQLVVAPSWRELLLVLNQFLRHLIKEK